MKKRYEKWIRTISKAMSEVDNSLEDLELSSCLTKKDEDFESLSSKIVKLQDIKKALKIARGIIADLLEDELGQ